MENVRILWCGTGIELQKSQGARYQGLSITGCSQYAVVSPVNDPAESTYANTNAEFSRCRFTDNAVAVYLEQGRNFRFDQCALENNGEEAVKMVSQEDLGTISFESCWFESNLKNIQATDGPRGYVYISVENGKTPYHISFTHNHWQYFPDSNQDRIRYIVIDQVENLGLINDFFLGQDRQPMFRIEKSASGIVLGLPRSVVEVADEVTTQEDILYLSPSTIERARAITS